MNVISERNRSAHCPTCGSVLLHKSRRENFVEDFLHYILFLSPYRCGECDGRHLRLRLSKAL
jgi:DNA-directed RNA polymerase subunit RPC12/RpoP